VLAAVTILIGLQALFTHWPPMHELFHMAPLDAPAWGRIRVFGIGVLVAVELEQAVVWHRSRQIR
jgi:hypothetical protein